MIVTICGLMEGWSIPRCRTLHVLEAMEFWGKYAPSVLNATEGSPFVVGQYRVWASDIILMPL